MEIHATRIGSKEKGGGLWSSSTTKTYEQPVTALARPLRAMVKNDIENWEDGSPPSFEEPLSEYLGAAIGGLKRAELEPEG